MPFPLAIWTLRHSRGTHFARWLADLQGTALQVEPFAPREGEEPVPEDPSEMISARLAGGASFLHCVDDHDEHFHWALANAASRLGYRHWIVYQRDPLHRALGHAMADPEMAGRRTLDVPALVERVDRMHRRLALVRNFMRSRKLSRRTDTFEPLFEDRANVEARRQRWREVLAHAQQPDLDDEALDRLFDRLQAAEFATPRPAALEFAGIELLTQELATLPGFEVRQSFLHPKLDAPAAESLPISLLRVTGLPPFTEEGQPLAPAGVAVARQVPPPPAVLEIVQGGHRHPVNWPLPSEPLATQWPGLANAALARFRAKPLPARANAPWRFEWRTDGQPPAIVGELRFQPEPKARIEGVFLARWHVGYQPIAGAASTRILLALFELATGRPFDAGGDVQAYFASRMHDVSGAWYRFTVVRDPIERFLANYARHVVAANLLTAPRLREMGLGAALRADPLLAEPTLGTFIDRLEIYLSVPWLKQRFAPLSDLLAPLDGFDHVFPVERLDLAAEELSRRTRATTIPAWSPAAARIRVQDLPANVRRRLERVHERDYELLSDHYPAPSGPGPS